MKPCIRKSWDAGVNFCFLFRSLEFIENGRSPQRHTAQIGLDLDFAASKSLILPIMKPISQLFLQLPAVSREDVSPYTELTS